MPRFQNPESQAAQADRWLGWMVFRDELESERGKDRGNRDRNHRMCEKHYFQF